MKAAEQGAAAAALAEQTRQRMESIRQAQEAIAAAQREREAQQSGGKS